MSKLPRPEDYSAKPAPSDSSAELQRWLDDVPAQGGKGEGAGAYLATQTLAISGNSDIGAAEGATFSLHNPTSATKLCNRVPVFPSDPDPEARKCIGIRLHDITITGNPKLPGGEDGNLDFTGVAGLTLERVRLADSMWGVVLSNCRNYRLIDLEVTHWGTLTPFTGGEGGGQYNGGCAIFAWTPNFEGAVIRPWFHGGHGGGGWFNADGRGLLCTGGVADGCNEFGFVGWPADSVVWDCEARHVRRVDVSGHGFENNRSKLPGRLVYRHNRAVDCDGAGHYFTDQRDAQIEDNSAELVNMGNPRWSPMSGAFIFRTADASAPGRNVSFKRNRARNGLAWHAVSMVNFSGSEKALVTDFVGADNDWGDAAQWSHGAVGTYDSAAHVLGAGSVVA